MNHLHLSLLGPFQVSLPAHEKELSFATDKMRALFAYLAMEMDRPFRRDTLAALLWGESPNKVARGNLRKELYRLRRLLSRTMPLEPNKELFSSTRQTIQLNSGVLKVDALTFQQRLASCTQHPHRHLHTCLPCLERLSEAVGLYRGEFMQGFSLADASAFEEWLTIERSRLHHQMMAALSELADASIERADYENALNFAQKQLALEAWQESAHRQVMRLFALQGEVQKGLEQYEKCRQILADELGVEPDEESKRLYQQLKKGLSHSTDASPTAVLHHFPTQFTPFIGGTRELGLITEHLLNPDCHLFTLRGTGGMGKSRLAIAAAQNLTQSTSLFSDGIYFVPLVDVTSTDLLLPTIAHYVGLTLRGRTSVFDQLVTFLKDKQTLIVLDNFEQLVAGGMELVTLLTALPTLKLLVTSREALHLQAEWQFAVEGLDYAQEEVEAAKVEAYSAAQLFVQTGKRAQAGWLPTLAEWQAIAQICQVLQGMPMALEMSAMWLSHYSVLEIADYLSKELGLERFVSPWRDVSTRHRSLRAVFDHSWQMLSPAEQQMLRHLSVFRGGFQQEAALAVATGSQAILGTLLDRAWLQHTAQGRYGWHPLIQTYVAEKMQEESSSTHEAHSEYYLQFLAHQQAILESDKPKAATTCLQREIENIHAAWTWAVDEGAWERLYPAIPALTQFYNHTGRFVEARQHLSHAVSQMRTMAQTISRLIYTDGMTLLLSQYGHAEMNLGDTKKGIALAQEALTLATAQNHLPSKARAEQKVGFLQQFVGGYALAVQHLQEALNHYTELADQRQQAKTLNYLGITYWRLADYPRATASLEQGKARYETIGSPIGLMSCVANLGIIYKYQQNYAQAILNYRQAIRLGQQLEIPSAVASNLANLGALYEECYDYEQALRCYYQGLEQAKQISLQGLIAVTLSNLGVIHYRQGRYAEAMSHFEQALAIETRMDNKISMAERHLWMGMVHRAQKKLLFASSHFDQALALLQGTGAKRDIARTLIRKAELRYEQGAYNEAQRLNDEGKQLAEEVNKQDECFRADVLAARLMAVRGEDSAGEALLHGLLSKSRHEIQQATLHFTLWEISGCREQGKQAHKLYEKWVKQTQNITYQQKIEQLRRIL